MARVCIATLEKFRKTRGRSRELLPEKTLQEYAYERLDLTMGSTDVDLTQPGYICSGKDGNSADRRLQVLNITDEALTVIVVPLSSEHETVASTLAKRTPSNLAVMRWVVEDAVRCASPMLCTVDRRKNFMQTHSAASGMLLILAKSDRDTTRVLDARYVGGNKSFALAVLPKVLEEGGEPFKVQFDNLTESIVEEVLDHMGGTTVPQIKVRVNFATFTESTSGRGLRIDTCTLDALISNTIGRLRLQIGGYVDDEQDMYIWYNERLLEDELTLSELPVGKDGDLQIVGHVAATVVSVYLLPGRKEGRLAHVANSAKSGGSDNAVTKISVSGVNWTTNQEQAVSLKVDVLEKVSHVKKRAVQAIVGEWTMHLHDDRLSDTVLACCGPAWNDSAPADIYMATLEDPQQSVSLICGDKMYYELPVLLGKESCCFVWPWKALLPLAERDFSERDVNDFDVQTFSLYSSKIVVVNRTDAIIHISCFPTLSKYRNIKYVEVSAGYGGVAAGVAAEVETTTKRHQGYGAVEDPCLGGMGAFEIVNIPKDMVRDMSVVVGVESADRQSIGYKRVKNMRGGQQLDVLEHFLTTSSKYTHPVGQPSKVALAANFLQTP